MTRTAAIQTVEAILAEEVTGYSSSYGEVAESGKWLLWEISVSGRTTDRIVRRIKSAGVKAAWARDGKLGILADQDGTAKRAAPKTQSHSSNWYGTGRAGWTRNSNGVWLDEAGDPQF